VERFEADSKFFRCLAVVLALLFGSLLLQRPFAPLAVLTVLALLLLVSIPRTCSARWIATAQRMPAAPGDTRTRTGAKVLTLLRVAA
jgi:hypothetical protein